MAATSTISIPIAGMHCAACQSRVQGALAQTPGVSDATVNLLLNNATVTYDQAVVRPDGPTLGSTACAGGGGDYLSNEIAYRATLLRDRLGLHDRLPGGHVHTPVLQFGAGNTDPATGAVTDPEFVRNRLDIIAQVRAILTVAAGAPDATR